MGSAHWMSPNGTKPSWKDGDDGISYKGEVLQHSGAYQGNEFTQEDCKDDVFNLDHSRCPLEEVG